jgi:hypothetical protein
LNFSTSSSEVRTTKGKAWTWRNKQGRLAVDSLWDSGASVFRE